MSTHAEPIVPTILFISDQRHPWKLAELTRHGVAYHTPTTVRVGTKGGTTRHQHQVYCIVDDATWEIAQATQASLQQQLDDLAAGLRELGSYAKRLADAGGMKQAPNPLTPTVIAAPDPDTSDAGSWWTNRLVPRIDRRAIRGHTPKMLRGFSGEYETLFSQGDNFVCPTDAAWARIEVLREMAQEAAQAWERLLRSLGTYSEALADGRYAKTEGFMQTTTAPAKSIEQEPTVQAIATLTDRAAARGVRITPQPDGRLLLSYVNVTPPRVVRFEPFTPTEALIWLASYEESQALAVTDQPFVGVPMMDQAEARETLDLMAGDIGMIDAYGDSFRRRALDFKEREGWKALGYAGYIEAIQAELGAQYSKSYLSRLIQAAEIERVLELPIGNSVPESVLREVAKADTPAQQRAAYSAATADGPATAKKAQAAVQERTPKPAPALHPDYQHQAAVEQILQTLDQWAESERYARCQDAYDQARQIHDVTLYNRAFAAIDRAIDGQATAAAPRPMAVSAGARGSIWRTRSVVAV